MHKVNERVIAVLSADESEVKVLGHGTYVGDEIPPVDGPGVVGLLGKAKLPNPKIVLDNGKVVWGCECWWGPENANFTEFVGQRRVVEVDIDVERATVAQERL